ncbi:MAG: amino acid racemase [Treponema sp.]|nr:amino acid racemase [Treponema sp.]
MDIVGVIGGMGPHAGLDFSKLIFANTKAKTDQEHINCMMISCSSLIPDRNTFLLYDKGDNPAHGMFESARRLYLAGVRFAAVACNTAHAGKIFSLFLSKVREELPDLIIVNMLETCALGSSKYKRLGLLATIGTHESKVYHEYFTPDKFELLEPDAQGRERIHRAIFDESFGIKAHSNEIKDEAVALIKGEMYALAERGAEAVILGCTELPLAMRGEAGFEVPFVDPALLAARRLVELVAPERLVG